MSKNAKNFIRPEYLKNFTKNIEQRIIITAKADKKLRMLDEMMVDINHDLNIIIQNINLKVRDRQIPYITLSVRHESTVDPSSRFVIRNFETSPVFEQTIKSQLKSSVSLSHMIDILVALGYLTIGQGEISDIELIISPEYVHSAIIDIALDIAMFNSYSFLKDMELDKKREASKLKYIFYKDRGDVSIYECKKEDLPYFSLAFLARNSEDEFDVDRYIGYWEDFVSRYYPDCVHREQTIKEQIGKHVDVEELPKNVLRHFANRPKGAYLLLRTNKDRTEDLHPQVFNLFGIDRYRKGRIKVVDISEHDKYRKLLENLDISAFKVVKQ